MLKKTHGQNFGNKNFGWWADGHHLHVSNAWSMYLNKKY